MDLFGFLFLCCISFLIGIIVTLVVQYFILYTYFQKGPVVKPCLRQKSVDYSLPESLKRQIEESEELNDKKNGSSLPISLVLQFLFHELRHSESIKRWLYKKLSLEFEELLTKTTIGKFFENINIKDMNLGCQFPDIKDITIDDVKLDGKEGHIDTVSLDLDLEYTGNFLLCIEAKMKFGKTAYLSIRVKQISGRARLQFTRFPYTHWSFSFYQEPIMDLAVESHFQGRQLQSNITNLIVNQIKKAIRRKHTLPNYKIRYKPFFVKTDPSQLDLDDNEIVPEGHLEVTCIEISRLEMLTGIHSVYCTAAVDTIPWICLYHSDDKIFLMLEITITKLRQAQLGVIFRQDQGIVTVESISPHSCSARSGLKPGDTVLAVENKSVNTVPQVAKLIKSVSSATITLKIQRQADSHHFKLKATEKPEHKPTAPSEGDSDDAETDSFVVIGAKSKSGAAGLEKSKVNERGVKLGGCNENVSKFAQTIGNFTLRKRKASFTLSSNENSGRNTPTSSMPGTPQHTPFKHNSISPASILTTKKNSISEVPEIVRTSESSSDTETSNLTEVQRSKEVASNPVVIFNEEFQFCLKHGLKYLNVNVWGVGSDEKDVLLGFANIPLTHILNECCNSVLGHYMRTYSFLPPTQPSSATHPLMSHSGFEHVFCYGDILLSFVWNHDDDINIKRKSSTATHDADTKSLEVNLTAKHDFIRTQFHRTTHCDFCSKKIWLKDAVQCRGCGLCCHKKCIAKCQMSTGCVSGSNEAVQPEITMTEPCDDVESAQPFSEGALKRVNSVNNLAIPGCAVAPAVSKSLPPSPQRTPSRKQSISSLNPFALCPSVLEEVQNQPLDASDSVNRLLEQVMLCPPDESLMEAAKETGKQLYANMSHEDRVEKVNLMMAELKKTLDAVTLHHLELSKQMNVEESEPEKAKLAFLMGQADAKVHGLSVLMLHYCSSLQYSQEKIV